MFQLTVLYNHPDDPATFDKYYDEVHVPLAAKLPGLRHFAVSRPGPNPDGSKAAYHLVAVLEFDDQAAVGAAMGSPEGQATQADLGNFAQAGVTMLAGPGTVAT